MKTINIPLPSIDGAELKNATVDLERGLVIAEYGEVAFTPRHGDIVCLKDDPRCIFIFKSGRRRTSFIAGVTSGYLIIDKNHIMAMRGDSDVLKATPEQQQLLFDALAKECKKWNPDTLEIEDIEQRILVPESISIYRFNKGEGVSGDMLGIGFGDNQVLCFGRSNYIVKELVGLDFGKTVQCYLKPCKREDLKAGDTALSVLDLEFFDTDILVSYNYRKIVDEENSVCVSIFGDTVRSDSDRNWYKLIPLNDNN